MFPDVTFELNYEWSSEEGEGKQPGYFSANLQVCSHADLDKLEKSKN